MNLQELKAKSAKDILQLAEELNVENASTLKKQDLIFGILKNSVANKVDISIQVPSNDTQHIQEGHVISYHIIAGLVEELMSPGGSN
jgi:transcription termination factor Rho